MEKLKEKLTIPNIIILFILLQPIIDIITGLSIQYANATITFGIVIRTIFMVFLVILGLIKADKKYRIGMYIYYGLLSIYMLGFLTNAYMQNGTALLFIQIKGLIKNFYLPIIFVALIPIFKEYKISINSKVLTTTLMIYVVTIFICNICGIGFLTYKAGDKAGTVGLFYSANEIGAILCLLSPFLVVDLLKEKLSWIKGISFVLFVYAVLQLGTKVPYFGLIILILTLVFACIINGKTQKMKQLYKKAGLLFASLVVIYLLTGLTPVGENLTKIYGDVFVVTKEDFQFGNKQEPSKMTEFKNFEELKAASVSGRNDFLKINKEKFKNGNAMTKLLGIGFVEKQDSKLEELKLTEMDYYDILFCNGIIGTVLFAIPILVFIITIMRYTILNRRKIKIEPIYSIVMAAVVALLAGHVLVSPAVSIYVVIILLKYNFDIRQLETQEEL